jgi:hypothetical protein
MMPKGWRSSPAPAGSRPCGSRARAARGEATASARVAETPASTPVGRRGSPMDVPRGTNAPGNIGGRQYTGHAFDQMQGRGITPSAVEHALRSSVGLPGRDGATIYTARELTVIVNPNGSIKTVIPR